MYKYFIQISWRNLTKRGTFPIINIAGLSIGLTVVLLISMLIYNEWSFDKSFKESKNIYRINSYLTAFMPGETFCSTANAVGPAMTESVPEVITAVRTYPTTSVIRINDEPLSLKITWADEDFFRLFDTPFLYGNPEDVMKQPNAVAISEQMAKKLFGNNNPMGETFSLDNEHIMEVKAVYKDFQKNTSFHEFQAIGPFKHSYPSWFHDQLHWSNIDFETFCLLSEKADTASVGAQMKKVTSDATEGKGFFIPSLQRLDEIHLYSGKYNNSKTSSQSDIGKVRMLSLLAVIILIVACINYMNLSTARSQKRSKEIGVSKTIGAKRSEVITRLILETGMITAFSFILAFGLAFLSLPVFNDLLNEQLQFTLAFKPLFLLGALLIFLITTIVAASYPAIYLSGFPPLKAIRQGGFSGKSSHAMVRKVLTVGQFAVAVVLIAWVFIIQTQIRYVNNKDIGYNPHNLIGISLFSLPRGADLEALANDYRAESSVEMVSRESSFLFYGNGNVILKNVDDQMGSSLWSLAADQHFVDLMQLKLIAGTALPQRHPEDTITRIVLNRAAIEYLETTPEEVIGKIVLADIGEGATQVCGVVENFNFEPLYRPVSPFCIHNSARQSKSVIMLRVKEGNLSEHLATYEQIFKKHFPNELFNASFPDQELEKAYEAERRTNRVAVVFSVLAILVACMGVFGLTAFMAEQRTKEIGIRKVLGASLGNVIRLFTDSYVQLLLISLVIAIPVAWWVGYLYLQDFAYRISIGWWIFAVAAIITIVLTLLTVSFQAIKAATANPVKAIKSE